MKKFSRFIIGFPLILLSFNVLAFSIPNASNEFFIQGTIENIKDGTLITLHDIDRQVIIASGEIKKGKFIL